MKIARLSYFNPLLLQHAFITRPRPPNVIFDLITRTKTAVRELDNLNYRKMKKILMVDSRDNDANFHHQPDMEEYVVRV